MEAGAYLALRVPPAALGLEAEAYGELIQVLRAQATDLTPNDAAREAWVLGELYGMEAQFLRRQLSSGSGAEGSFAMSEISARMQAALADRDAARAEFTRLTTPTPQPQRATRGSGSVAITFEG